LNYVKGVTSGIQTQFGGLSSTYVGKEGNQEMEGTLTVHEELRVIADLASSDYDGLAIYDAAGNTLGGFWYDETTGAVAVGNWRPNESGAETVAVFEAGLVSVISQTIAGTPVPTHDTHLANKKYVDDNGGGGYPVEKAYPTPGNNYDYAIVPGRLQVKNEVSVAAGIGAPNEFAGFTIYTPDPFNFNVQEVHGAFAYDDVLNTLSIYQGANENLASDTIAQFKDGVVKVWSGTGKSLVPQDADDLCNKAYVDGQLLAATGQAVGASGTFEDNNGKTITVVNGLITDLG